MSDVPRFDCFDDGMREGYSERWVRSSDYDALRAKRDAQRARANANEMCAAAVAEIRRVCAEIMGGNMAFVDDDFARCLLTLRDDRDALAKENAALRTLLVETLPHIHGNVAEWMMLLNRPGMRPDAYATASERINSGDALLARIDAAVKS